MIKDITTYSFILLYKKKKENRLKVERTKHT